MRHDNAFGCVCLCARLRSVDYPPVGNDACSFPLTQRVEHVDNRNILDFVKEAHFYNQL